MNSRLNKINNNVINIKAKQCIHTITTSIIIMLIIVLIIAFLFHFYGNISVSNSNILIPKEPLYLKPYKCIVLDTRLLTQPTTASMPIQEFQLNKLFPTS